MVDIHSHILPGLDDGPKTLEDAVAMLKIAAESGTTDIVATPHANARFTFDSERIDRKIAELQGVSGPVPRIHSGCDFHLTIENIQDALAYRSKYTINHKRYLLVEFSDALIPNTTQEIFDRFQAAGLVPVVTHPERNAVLQNRIDQLGSWVENGAGASHGPIFPRAAGRPGVSPSNCSTGIWCTSSPVTRMIPNTGPQF